MAPPDGLEPPNVGIKIRCLTNLAKREQSVGIPRETRTPTKGFGDPYAAITPARHKFGGTSRTRTDRLLLAKQALSQMSYGPLLFSKLSKTQSSVDRIS